MEIITKKELIRKVKKLHKKEFLCFKTYHSAIDSNFYTLDELKFKIPSNKQIFEVNLKNHIDFTEGFGYMIDLNQFVTFYIKIKD